MKPLKIGELARETGLTVRALHHYDEIGLLSPSFRTISNHRLYTDKDIQQLQKIMLLQLLGFSLAEIKICLEKEDFPFEAMAKSHLNRLRIEMQSQKVLCNRIESVMAALNHKHALSSKDNAIETIRAIIMYEKYYTPEQIETLKERQKALSNEELERVRLDWELLFKEFENAFNAGKKSNDTSVILLGKKANALVKEFTGGDPELEKAHQAMYQTEGGHNVLASHGVKMSAELFQFMAQSMAEAKKK